MYSPIVWLSISTLLNLIKIKAHRHSYTMATDNYISYIHGRVLSHFITNKPWKGKWTIENKEMLVDMVSYRNVLIHLCYFYIWNSLQLCEGGDFSYFCSYESIVEYACSIPIDAYTTSIICWYLSFLQVAPHYCSQLLIFFFASHKYS